MRSLLLVLVCAGCATTRSTPPEVAPAATPATPSPPPKKTPDEVKAELTALLARESATGPMQTFTLGDQTLTVESVTPVSVQAGKDEHAPRVIKLGLGASELVSCFLYPQAPDIGALLWSMLNSLKKAGFGINSVEITDLTVVEKSPATFVEIAYLVTKDGEQKLGVLKLMLYAHDEATSMCLHDEPGYSKSFVRVASSFAGATARALSVVSKTAIYRTVSITRVQDHIIGFERSEWFKTGAGVKIVTMTSSMIARSPTDVMASDAFTSVETGKDGFVTSKVTASVEGGEVAHKFLLTRTKNGYHFEGEQQGKALSGDLKTTDGKGLPSDVLIARRVLALNAKKPTVAFDDYLPTFNPAAFTQVTLTRDPKNPTHVEMVTGPMKMATVIDSAGMPESFTLQAGPLAIEQQRVFAEGKPE